MITINTLTVSSDRTSITVSVTTDASNFTSVNLWTQDTYKDYNEAIDLSSLSSLSGQTEDFTIAASDVGISEFDGLYFIEFEDSDNNTQLGAVAELTSYKQCLLDASLEVLQDNVNVLQGSGCGNPKFNKIIYVHSLLSAVQAAILSGYYGEAIDIVSALETICDDCETCESLDSILSLGTLNNSVIIL